ncbi:uncharacterized protein LOC143287509 [Babylonia areolata]|uniref:uncharacterized protein LOC143287509 n=1 Tax=Babylonia areolata TaxID=304850 RepID=UPI003FCF9B38
MSPDSKAKLTYLMLGSIYFVGGIEHGVSVPRGWLHWRQHAVQASSMAGMAVAAYSVATLLVAPFVGRWVDKPGRSRRVLIVGACLHITGATLEIFLADQWVTVVARLISGIGGGTDAAVLSETSRYTRPTRRTSAMALLVGARLLGYMLVPGLDSLMWRVVLTQIHLPDRRTAVLGLFLAVTWCAVLLLTTMLYTDLCRLQPPSQHASSAPSPASTPQHPSGDTSMLVSGTVPSVLGDDSEGVHNASFTSSQPVSFTASLTSSQCSESSTQHLLGKSSEMIEEAEKCIQRMAEQSFSSAVTVYNSEEMEPSSAVSKCEIVRQQPSEADEDLNELMPTAFSHDRRSRSSSGQEAWSCVESGQVTGTQQALCGSVRRSSEALDQNSYVKRSGVLPRRLQNESWVYVLYEEFIRHDVIALLAVIMSGSFAHLCFQMMITPVTQRFLEAQDLYVIILFCLALVLLLVVCGSVWVCSPHHRVLHMLGAGACVLIAGIILFMVLLHHMATHDGDTEEHMAQISVCVGLYVVGLPLLLISATSVYTLQSGYRHHGLRQGVYHSALSVSAILAPLWIEGTMTHFFLHHAVIVGLLVISLVTICCSHKELSSLQEPVARARGSRRHQVGHTHSVGTSISEQQPLLPDNTARGH